MGDSLKIDSRVALREFLNESCKHTSYFGCLFEDMRNVDGLKKTEFCANEKMSF